MKNLIISLSICLLNCPLFAMNQDNLIPLHRNNELVGYMAGIANDEFVANIEAQIRDKKSITLEDIEACMCTGLYNKDKQLIAKVVQKGAIAPGTLIILQTNEEEKANEIHTIIENNKKFVKGGIAKQIESDEMGSTNMFALGLVATGMISFALGAAIVYMKLHK